jgi:hypothetical protein
MIDENQETASCCLQYYLKESQVYICKNGGGAGIKF